MATAKRAVEILADAEQKLRNLVGEAAGAGEYDDVQRIVDGARMLSTLAKAWQNGSPGGLPSVADPTASHRGSKSTDRAPSQRTASAPNRPPKRPPAKGDYPKFFRQGDHLVKIGWSKKERSEYQHKAPRRVIDALAAAIARCAADAKMFTVEVLLPLKDQSDGSELPGYQVYVALAWFKAAGLVKQHGRRGYSVRNSERLAPNLAATWNQLQVAP